MLLTVKSHSSRFQVWIKLLPCQTTVLLDTPSFCYLALAEGLCSLGTHTVQVPALQTLNRSGRRAYFLFFLPGGRHTDKAWNPQDWPPVCCYPYCSPFFPSSISTRQACFILLLVLEIMPLFVNFSFHDSEVMELILETGKLTII